MAFFVGMSTCIKAGRRVAGRRDRVLPLLLRHRCRCCAVLPWRGELRTALATKPAAQPHRCAALVGVIAMGLGFFALTRLPLPEAITLNYAQPLLVVVFSALFLGEAIRVYRWSAVAVGLIGVLIISWPKLTLFAARRRHRRRARRSASSPRWSRPAMSAMALLLVRSLVRTERTGDHRPVVLADRQR